MTVRRAAIALALAILLPATVAADASARPPVLTVGRRRRQPGDRPLDASGGRRRGVRADRDQSGRDPFGYFRQRFLVSFSNVGRNDTTFRDTLRLLPGTYYVHVAGSDHRCFPDCPRIEFTDVFRIQIGAAGTAQGNNLADEGQPPSQLVYCRRKQSLRKMWVKARMDINGSLIAAGKLTASTKVGAVAHVRRRAGHEARRCECHRQDSAQAVARRVARRAQIAGRRAVGRVLRSRSPPATARAAPRSARSAFA